MGRRIALLLRPLLQSRHLSETPFLPRFFSVSSPPPSSLGAPSPPPCPPSLSVFSSDPFFFSPSSASSPRRTFSSSSGSSNIVVVGTAEELDSSLKRVQESGSPGIFYFTATWCGPCKFISPILEELSKVYPHVTTYKIDIDKEGLESKLTELKVYSVPNLKFFKDGKMAAQVIGANPKELKDTMENLYKME
uniref:Thioredoxin o n=1 Tax=Symplocarpus renifolius TaxID=477955 RepID=A0A0U5ALL5_9ARAE|nr:thioredoxin o [Symplocarpus renifolius]